MTTSPPHYGFPPKLLDALDMLHPGPGPMTPCGLCGDTILGQRHRIIDAITEKLSVGDVDVGEDYGIPAHDLWIIVMASYEHDKALKRQRRAEAKTARPRMTAHPALQTPGAPLPTTKGA